CAAPLTPRVSPGERLASPRRVRFAAEVARHLLRWEPGHGCPSSARYDVEYKVYGSSIPWTAVPECRRSSGLSCDLTHYTPDPERRYYARVRAVSGSHTSPWQKSSAFSPQEASPRLVGQSLSVTGNAIQVRLQPLLHSGNVTQEYKDFQKNMARYLVYVRRTQDNQTLRVVESSAEFTISELLWGTRYCVSVELSMANRPGRATRTHEHCVTTGHREAELLPAILGSTFTTLLLLGLLGALLAHTYTRKPVRTPSVLKSFMKQSSLWVEHESPSSGSLDADPIQLLFLTHKEPQPDSSPGSSTSTARLPLEQGWRLPAWPKDRLCPLEPAASRDSSGTSTDSGICLHIPASSCSSSSSSSSLSCAAGPQGYRQQLPTAEDSGVGLDSPCPAPGRSSGSGNSSLGQPGLCAAASQQDVTFRGYLQQAKGTVEPQRHPERGLPLPGCAGSVQGLGSAHTLDTACSELAVSKGYLKQSCPLTQDPCRAPARDFSRQVEPQTPTLLSWGAPGAPVSCKGSPELLKPPLDLSIFDSPDLLVTLPLVSSLSSDWMTIKPLSQLGGDSKDSRL
ncbi:I10R1 protein, partial [Malurus elegans]|nr:I10R1 protein [Malurus elegans]